jgi:hypothetical protein
MTELDIDNEPWGAWDGECYACDLYGRVNDLFLCEECAGKLERDLIRQQNWDYTFTGFGLPTEARETVRNEVIKKYGKALELISDDAPTYGPLPGRRKKKRK